jgi:hypothetical protein
MKPARMVLLVTLLLSAVILITGCGSGDKEKNAELPTLEVGDTWTVNGMSDDVEYQMVVKVTGEDMTDGKDAYVLEAMIDPPLNATGISKMTGKVNKHTMEWIRQQASGEINGISFTMATSYSQKFSEMPFPYSIGKSWEVTEEESNVFSSMGRSEKTTETNTYVYQVEKIEKVTVTAGTFECFKILKYDDDENVVDTYWYSGKVKQNVKELDNETNETIEMVSYSVAH